MGAPAFPASDGMFVCELMRTLGSLYYCGEVVFCRFYGYLWGLLFLWVGFA